jgi:glycosyltransferase involved in cell wall biosynthesis/uncharacterized NAD(P)/FAD-binding protein YdhS
MKIAFAVVKHIAHGGGIERFTEELGAELVRRGHQVRVYSTRHYGPVNAEHRGMHIIGVPSVPLTAGEKLSAGLASVAHASFSSWADLVHLHTVGPGCVGFLPRLLGKKAVVQFHGIEWQRARWSGFGSRVLKALEQATVRTNRHFTAVSESQCAYFRQHYGLDIRFIPGGAERKTAPEPLEILSLGLQPRRYILFAARLVPEKGAHYLIDAFRRQDTAEHLVIAGDVPGAESYREELKCLAGNDPRILWPGFVQGRLRDELLGHARAFVLPSDLEGLSLALLEAMNFSNCCLVSDIPANLEALGDTGMTFRQGDPSDLAEKLRLLLQEPDPADLYGPRAAERALQFFSWEHVTDRFEALYTEILSGSRPALKKKSQPPPASIRAAIIGSGPRGLSVLERLLDGARSRPETHLEILLFDKQRHGEGCHRSGQSPHLLLNTAAGQITLFPKPEDAACPPHTRTFDEWIREAHAKGLHPELIQWQNGNIEDSYQPRALLGHYLRDILEGLLKTTGPNVTVRLIIGEVRGLAREPGPSWTVSTPTECFPGVDGVFLCSGHRLPGQPSSLKEDRFIPNPFPIRETLAEIPDGCTVAVKGMGLTALDVIAELTQGRGGRFEADGGGTALCYLPSGGEPRILAFGRSGFPLHARPVNQKTRPEERLGRHFTPERAGELTRSGPLNFQQDLLPLILRDMEEALHAARKRNPDEAGAGGDSPLVWESLAGGVTGAVLSTPEQFRSHLLAHLQTDCREAALGNLLSPDKSACDVLRDHRELMGGAVDFDGLDPESRGWFYREFLPVLKRLSVGPPKERIAQLLALIEAGILQMDFGPGAQCLRSGDGWEIQSPLWPEHRGRADYLIDARLPVDGPGNDPLLHQLVGDGYARHVHIGAQPGGGLDVDRSLRVLDREGAAVENLWALGVPTEGARFYTFYLPRPYARSRFEADAETVAESFFSFVTTRTGGASHAR